MAFFSVIIPVYNAESTLQECLDSVAGQTLRDFEVVIINDGSSDNSEKIITGWKAGNPDLSVEVITQNNSGLGAARNAGISLCRGEYIALLDADDIWKKNKLQQLRNTVDKSEYKWFYHTVEAFGAGKKRKRNIYKVGSLQDLLIKGNPIVPSAVCFKASLLKKYLFTTNTQFHGAEDLYLWIQLLADNEKPGYLNMALTEYREEGGMSTKLSEHLQKVFNVLQFFYEKGEYPQPVLTLAKRRKYLEAARFYHKRGRQDEAAKFYKAADFKSLRISGLRFLNFLGISL